MQKNRRTNFIGLYILTLNEKNKKQYQGQIVDQIGEYVLIDLFEWLAGSYTHKMLLPISALVGDKVKLFSDREEYVDWNEAWGKTWE